MSDCQGYKALHDRGRTPPLTRLPFLGRPLFLFGVWDLEGYSVGTVGTAGPHSRALWASLGTQSLNVPSHSSRAPGGPSILQSQCEGLSDPTRNFYRDLCRICHTTLSCVLSTGTREAPAGGVSEEETSCGETPCPEQNACCSPQWPFLQDMLW